MDSRSPRSMLFFFNDTATTEIYTLSLHDALPISKNWSQALDRIRGLGNRVRSRSPERSEEHTSELQSPDHLVCRLLLEKKKESAKADTASSGGHDGLRRNVVHMHCNLTDARSPCC